MPNLKNLPPGTKIVLIGAGDIPQNIINEILAHHGEVVIISPEKEDTLHAELEAIAFGKIPDKYTPAETQRKLLPPHKSKYHK